MKEGTKQTIGWSVIISGVLVALNEALQWPSKLQYLWAVIIALLGIWALLAGE